MRPEPGQVLHFSEDPTIETFAPHVARTARRPEAYVWAVNWHRAPDYWFPRQCPRAIAFAVPETTAQDRARILGPGGGERVHAVEYGWLEAMRTAELYAYRFDARDFVPCGADGGPDPAGAELTGPRVHAVVSGRTLAPLGPPERVGDLFALHEEAGIQLRVLPRLWEFWDEVTAATLCFSGIRLANAGPR